MANDAPAMQAAGEVGAPELARLLMISDRRVQQLAGDGHIPRSGHGKYPLIPAIQGYIRWLKSSNSPGGGNAGNVDYNATRARLVAAQAEQAEMELQAKKGALVPADEVEQLLRAQELAVRASLLGLEPRVMLRIGEFVAEQHKAVVSGALTDAADEVLHALADNRPIEGLPDAASDDDGDDAPPLQTNGSAQAEAQA